MDRIIQLHPIHNIRLSRKLPVRFDLDGIPSGGYWVRQMRQSPQAPLFCVPPLKNSTYSLNPLQMFVQSVKNDSE